MARAVSISTLAAEQEGNRWEIDYAIVNGGDYPIENVVLLVTDLTPDSDPKQQKYMAFELVVGTMHQKQTIKDKLTVHLSSAPAFAELTALGSLRFTDSWGNSWWRGPGELSPTPDPPRIC